MPGNNIKKDAPAVTGQGAPGTAGNGSATIAIIPSAPSGSQAVSGQNSTGPQGKGRFKKDKTHVLGINSKVNSLALKFYDEQLPGANSVYDPNGFLVQHDPNATPNFIDAIKATNPKDFQVLAIRHDRDEVTDGIWAVANVKPHWHVIVRLTDQSRRMRVKQILAGLGIVYRQGLDDELWKEHGVETIGNFAGYAVYLTHETAEAIRDAKERYDISEIVSNLTPEEIQQVREGYIRVSEKRKLTQDDLIALDSEAYDRGYALRTLDDWFANQPFNVRSAAKIKVITEHYYHGVEARIREHVEVKRVCIYIQGAPNRGKTYAAEHALLAMGRHVYHVQGGGTGKFDGLTAAHEAILIDDDTCPNLLNMTDDYICQAYKRGRNNPPWTGQLFVVTSNLSFYDWLEASGMHIYRRGKGGDVVVDAYGEPALTDRGRAHGPAMRSRFFLMHVETDADGVSHLELDLRQETRRGSIECQQAKIDTAAVFRDKFNTIIREYRPRQVTPDWKQFSFSKDGSAKLYQCRRCGHIGLLTPDTAVCGGCKLPMLDQTMLVLSENKFLDMAAERDADRMDALIGFACWFWTSVSGGYAWYIEQNPDELEIFRSDSGLILEVDMLKKAIEASSQRFSGATIVKSFQPDMVMDAVVHAWFGGFGDLPLLEDDPGYAAWERRILARGGHKICPVCRKSVPFDMRYCGDCGRPLPDMYFFDDTVERDVARYQLATERKCDVMDVPFEDVEARVPDIVMNTDY